MNQAVTIPPKRPGATWSDAAHREVYLAYVVEGLSALNTARRLTKRLGEPYTRNQVLGYAIRSDWPHVAETAVQPKSTPHPKTPPAHRSKVQKPGPRSRPLAECDPRDLDGRLLESNCKFPVGQSPPPGEMAGQLFCGETPQVGPYCDHHARIAYPPAAYQRAKERT